MNSFFIILSQIIFNDLREIRVAMIPFSLIFMALCIAILISMFYNVNITITLFFITAIFIIVENYMMPKLWNSKKLMEEEDENE